jgi:hypothetical protein
MLETASVINDAPVQQLGEDGPIWLEALPARTYKTPVYGEVPITPEKLDRMIKNFKENVRGQEIAIDYEHGFDNAKGKKAAGWYRELAIRPSSDDASVPALFARVEFTEEAKKEILDKQWKYFSLDWEDQWEDTDGNKHEDVIMGGGLTNRPVAKKTLPINFSESMWDELTDEEKAEQAAKAGLRIINEEAEWEHSEPGTGTPPTPKKDDPDISVEEGWRRSTPPDQTLPAGPDKPSNKLKGGDKVPEFVFAEENAFELLKALDLDHDAKPEKVVEKVKLMFGELAELKKNEDITEQEKQFAERYPQYWEEHSKLMEKNRTSEAKAFSEEIKSVRKAEGNGLKTTSNGLSPVALEAVIETHKKFADKTVTVEDFEGCLKKIMNGGLVQFGEVGSGTEKDQLPEIDNSTPAGIQASKKQFAEVMKNVQKENPDWDNRQVLAKVAEDHPDLFEASRVALPA